MRETEISSDERTMAVLAHVLAIFTGFLAPLIIWLIKKDESEFVDRHGRESLNFQITVAIAALVLTVTGSLLCFPVFLLPVLMVYDIVYCCLGASAANRGDDFAYPLILRLL